MKYYAQKKKKEKPKTQFSFHSKKYKSVAACCSEYGVNASSVRQRARDKNCSLEESFQHFMTRKRKKLLNNPEFDYHGTLYLSLKACCEELEIRLTYKISRRSFLNL